MKQFTYTITDPSGIHARPAGMLAKAAKALDSTVTIEKEDGKTAVATKLMAIMGLVIKCGNTVTVKIEGGDEEANAAVIEQFLLLHPLAQRGAIFSFSPKKHKNTPEEVAPSRIFCFYDAFSPRR